MASHTRQVLFLPGAKTYIDSMSGNDRGILARDMEALAASETGAIHIKLLERPIYEMIVGHHRFTYFELRGRLYVVRGFRKKSAKTPKKEIQYAHQIYKILHAQ